MKRCSSCGETFLLEAFAKRGDGYDYRCRSCKASQDRRRKEAGKAFVDSIKDVPCTDCGVRYPPHIMDLDHLPEFDKEFDIGTKLNYPMHKLVAEVAKCEVVCANCHRERTFQRRSNEPDRKVHQEQRPSQARLF